MAIKKSPRTSPLNCWILMGFLLEVITHNLILKKKDQIAIVSVSHFIPNRWTNELNSSSSLSLPHYLNETKYQTDECSMGTIWNRLYVISYQMERAEKTCFIHCVKFIVFFVLCKFHKFSWQLATDLWEQSVLHQLNQDVAIFLYIHWRLSKRQTQDILTGQIRLKSETSYRWPAIMLSTENGASESWNDSSDELHGMISLLTFLGIPFSSLLWQPLKSIS